MEYRQCPNETQMIYESAPWKNELKLYVHDLLPFKTDCKEGVPFKLERALFLSAFVVRKLRESHKLTDKIASQELEVSFHAAIDRKMLAHLREMPGGLEIGKDFEDHCTKGKTSLAKVANRIIHSLSLVWIVDNDCLATSFFICSDTSQHKNAMLVSLDDWCRLISSVAEDDVAGLVAYTDSRTGKMIKRNFGWDEETYQRVDFSEMKIPRVDEGE